jgi:hypothetical protein
VNRSFGPWSTAIATGSHHQLETFWKRRLALLPSLSRSGPNFSRRIALSLCLLGAAILALPILRLGAAPPPADPQADTPAEAAVSDDQKEFAPSGDAEKHAVAPTAQKAASSPEYFPRPNKDEERIIKALETPIVVEFADLPLEDCLTFIAEYPNLPKFTMHLDRVNLADEGVALDQPITLKLKGLRLESVLHLLLRPVQLGFFVEDDVLKIATAAKAGEIMFTRTYPVRDLYSERTAPARQGSQLVDSLKKTIEPDSWSELSGDGEIRYVNQTDSLVIRQTWSVHRQVVQLLRDLREAKRMEATETN